MHPTGSNSSTLDGELRQDGGGPKLAPWGRRTGCRDDAMPFPSSFPTKSGLLPSFFLFLPPICLLGPCCFAIRPAVRLQRPLFAACNTYLQCLGALSLSIPSFALSSLYLYSSLCPNCSGCYGICRRRNPRRISFSELARRVLISIRLSSIALSSRNTLNPRRRKTTRGHWASGISKFTALTSHGFREKPLNLILSYLQ